MLKGYTKKFISRVSGKCESCSCRPNTNVGDTRGSIVILLLRVYEGRLYHSRENLREGGNSSDRRRNGMLPLPCAASTRANSSMEIAAK